MKILHTADWHLGDRLGSRRIDRTPDLKAQVERIARYCEEEAVDVLLIAGDLWSEANRQDTLSDSLRHLEEVFVPFLRQGGTIVALTGNHDNETFCSTLRHTLTLASPASMPVGSLVTRGRFYLAHGPTFYRIEDRAGLPVQFVLMPYPSASRYLDASDPAWTPEERHRSLLNAYLQKLSEIQGHERFDRRVRTVFSAHIHVQGSKLSNLFRMSERESILFDPNALPTGWDYVALGHIHQPQSLLGLPHVRYSGSIERLDLGERHDEKQVVLVDIGPEGRRCEPVCLPLQATPIYEVTIADWRSEGPGLLERFPEHERALASIDLTYKPGEENHLAILDELARLFPRWYDRRWRAGGAGEAPGVAPTLRPTASFHDTVVEYVKEKLAGHADAADVLTLTEHFLSERQP